MCLLETLHVVGQGPDPWDCVCACAHMPNRLRVNSLSSFTAVTQGEETHVRPSCGARHTVFAPAGEDLCDSVSFQTRSGKFL